MPTSSFFSRVPPNHAETRPPLPSAMVEAWQLGNGAFSKMNSDFTMAVCGSAAAREKLESISANQIAEVIAPILVSFLIIADTFPVGGFSQSRKKRRGLQSNAIRRRYDSCELAYWPAGKWMN